MKVLLPASPHARGARPYIFKGIYYGEPIPGIVQRGMTVHAAVDAAWLLELPIMRGGPAWPWRGPLDPFAIETIKLYQFQLEGMRFLADRDYALLADEMGLGKTAQALCAAEERLVTARRWDNYDTPMVLILCPALAKRHWAREVRRWTGYEAAILDGLKTRELPQARYLIANYDILLGQRRRDDAGKLQAKEGLEGWGKVLKSQMPPIVILDEAHLLRGEKSQRTKMVKELCRHTTVVWALTGTPMPNKVRDLWALGDIVTGGLLGSYWDFVKAYCGAYQGQYGMVVDGESRLDELQKRLGFWMLGRDKASVGLQLPEKRREVQIVDVGRVDIRMGPSSHIRERTNIVASALRATARAKRQAVIDMAKEALDAGQKVVIGVYLREQAEEIGKALAGYSGVAVSGDASPEQRDIWAQGFREQFGACFFVCTIDSMQLAISLVGADLVIVGDLTWDPTKLLQFEGRAHRIGSGKPVLIRYLVAAGTIDEAVQESVIDKLDVIGQALGATSDQNSLTAQLGRDTSTTEQIIDRLFQRLMGG